MIILSFCFPRSGGGFLIEEPRSVRTTKHQNFTKLIKIAAPTKCARFLATSIRDRRNNNPSNNEEDRRVFLFIERIVGNSIECELAGVRN